MKTLTSISHWRLKRLGPACKFKPSATQC